MCGQSEFGATLASEESEACFVLPVREAVAHFARRNTRSMETEWIAMTIAMPIRALKNPQSYE